MKTKSKENQKRGIFLGYTRGRFKGSKKSKRKQKKKKKACDRLKKGKSQSDQKSMDMQPVDQRS